MDDRTGDGRQPASGGRQRWQRTLVTLAAVVGVLTIFSVFNDVWDLAQKLGSAVIGTPDAAGPARDDGTAVSAGPDLVFSETFSTAKLSNDWHPVSGTWSIEQGALTGRRQAAPDRWATITLDRAVPPDCEVAFRVKVSDATGVAELILHLSDNRYIRVYLYPLTGVVMFGDGTITSRGGAGGPDLAQAEYPIRPDEWYQLTVTARGARYSIKIDGRTVIEHEDEKLSRAGAIGFTSNSVMVQFDELTVRRTAD